MVRLTNGIRDGPERSFNCRKRHDVERPNARSWGGYCVQAGGLPTMISKDALGRGRICVKDSGHREIEFGTMVRVIPALAGCREWGF